MKTFLTVLMAVLLISAQASYASELRCDNTQLAKQVVEHRNVFNKAIKDADLSKIELLLSNNNILMTGSDSDLYASKKEHLDIWKADFSADKERIIYVRTPTCIDVSKLGSMAMEHGKWVGQKKSDVLFSGSYTAKWRLNKEQQTWQLEAEVYMTSYIK